MKLLVSCDIWGRSNFVFGGLFAFYKMLSPHAIAPFIIALINSFMMIKNYPAIGGIILLPGLFANNLSDQKHALAAHALAPAF